MPTFQEMIDALERNPLAALSVLLLFGLVYTFRGWRTESAGRLSDSKAHARELLETTRVMGQATENLRVSAEVIDRVARSRDA